MRRCGMPHISVLLILACWVCLLGSAPDAWAQACTHYASATGSGSTCTNESPCLVSSFWDLATPGTVLCLKDGTYTGSDSMIIVPAGVAGTQANPITIRALNDGAVLLDAQHAGPAVHIGWHGGGANDNQWMVVEGINAKNSDGEYLINVAGSDSIIRRSIGWDGVDGGFDANIFRVTGFRSRAVDCAGWGMNSRKIFDGAQQGNLDGAGFKRCWGEWNDWPNGGSWPTLTYQAGYNTTNQLFENIIGTMNVLGQTSGLDEGVFRAFRTRIGDVAHDSENMRVLGSIFYHRDGSNVSSPVIFTTEYIKNLYIEDTVARATTTQTSIPFNFEAGCDGGCSGNVCSNCLSIHAGTPSINLPGSGFSLPNWREGEGLAAATGGTSAFVLLPGICKRYENGVLTTTPLWPWPMNQRILDARAASGYAAVDVTAEIESILGTIPAQCRSDTGDTEDPTVAVTAPEDLATVSGVLVSVTADATDNVGVVGVQFQLDGENLGAEDTSSPYAITWNTTLVANGDYELTAVARDAAGNTATSAVITVTVSNAVPQLTVFPTTVDLGGSVTATWTNILNPTATDWIGLYVPATANEDFLTWEYTDGNGSGSLSYPIPGAPFAPGTYELRLFSNDLFILLDVSNSFTVNGPDTTDPTVAMTAPTDLATVAGHAVSLTADATDNVGVVGVQFKVNGTNQGAEDTSAPYAITWDTFFLTDGNYTITALARDAATNDALSAAITVTVRNNPTDGAITANSVVTFIGNPTGGSITAVADVSVVGNPTGGSITAVAVPVFLGNPTGGSITATSVPVFVGNPTGGSISIP